MLGNIEYDVTIKMLLKAQLNDINMATDWSGNLGWWYLNVKENLLYFNPLFLMTLGHLENEIDTCLSMDQFYDRLHDDDRKVVKSEFDAHIDGQQNVLELTFRIVSLDGSYRQYYVNGRLDSASVEEGVPFIIGTAYDVTSQYLTKKELRKQPIPKHQTLMQDNLTGLLSKEYFEEYLQHAITLARAGQQSFCLLLADLDFFKNINEHFGRDKGDLVLKEVAHILKKETRASDYIGRTGGDNFQIILTDVDFKTGQMISERIRKSIANHMFVSGIRITISGGLVYFKKQSYENLLSTAQLLLKKSKNGGHNKMSY